MDRYNSDVEAAVTSGHWRERSWWQNPDLLRELRLSHKQVDEIFAAVEMVFDWDWCNAQIDKLILEAKKSAAISHAKIGQQSELLEAWNRLLLEKQAEAKTRYEMYNAASSLCGAHPIFQFLFHRGGLDALMYLTRLGNSLTVLKDHGLLKDLPARLRADGQFAGAHAELVLIANWVVAGVDVERDVASGKGSGGKKNCDLKVSDGEDVIFVDIKRPMDSRARQEKKGLADKIMRLVRDVAKQVPAGGPGLAMISGHGNSDLTILTSELLEGIVGRFTERPQRYTDIAGVLVLRSIYLIGQGEVEVGTYVPNPNGPYLSTKLLKRGVVNFQEWDWKEKRIKGA